MEIFTYIIEGELSHRDSMGNAATLTPGKLQYMSAASGIVTANLIPPQIIKPHSIKYGWNPIQREENHFTLKSHLILKPQKTHLRFFTLVTAETIQPRYDKMLKYYLGKQIHR